MAGKILKSHGYMNFGSFPGGVSFHSGANNAEIIRDLKKCADTGWLKCFEDCAELMESPSLGFATRRFYKGKKYYFLVLKFDFKFTDHHMCVLAHEIVHLCQFHLPDILNRDNEIEAEAYTHTHLMTQALEQLRKAKSKIK